jgi:tetratricopeptide (TPR) repeat protein
MAATDQVMVGGIPRQPPGFRPPAELLAELGRTGTGVSVIHAVTQARGVGKTQLAAAYAQEKLAEGWRLVAWVNAGDTGSLLAELAAVAEAAGLTDDGPSDAGQAVRQRLEADGARCLLVFDDVADPEVVRAFVPVGGAARILITTTMRTAADLGASVPVDVFGAERAREFLAERTGLRDEAGAAAVAAELGYLPLALAQAAAVIAEQQLGYQTYLEMLRARPVGEDPAPEPSGQDRPSGGAIRAVLLSLDAVQAFDPTGACARVMEILAVLSEAGVRRELLHAAGYGVAMAGGQRVAPAVVDRALDQLADRALLTFTLDGRTIIVPSLIARAVRERLVRRRRLAAVGRAAAAVLETHADALTESQDPLMSPAIRNLAVQVTALLASVGGAAADRELGRVLLRLRFRALYHLIELGDSAHAVSVGEPLIADLERVLGPDHPDTLNSRNSLAAAYQDAGRVAEAMPLFERTLVDRERVLGPDHPDTLNSQNNLAAAYQDAGRVTEAILLFKLTLAARERLLGARHLSTVNSRGNLAAAYRDAGQFDEAIPLFELALADRQRLLGGDHPDTMRSRNNLASAYRKTGQMAKAIPLVEQILADRERLLGADHPRTLAARNNLAAAYRQVGRAADAIPLFEQTLAACERLLGAEDPRTLATRNSLALAYTEAGRAES